MAWLTVGGGGRLALGGVLGVIAVAVATRAPRAALLGLIGYLVVLGDLRRVLIPLVGWSGQDPLLLVAPLVVGLMSVSLLVARRLHPDTLMARGVALLMGLMALQILNPAQGGLAVGLAGALFYIVPLLWYWLGREHGSLELAGKALACVLIPLALASAGLVLFQAFVGFLPFEQAWIDVAGYAALFVSDTVRPFGFSTSTAECAHLLLIGIVAAWSFVLEGRNPLRWVAAIVLLGFALFLLGGRTSVVLGLTALSTMWAVQGVEARVWVPRLALAMAIGAVSLVGVLGWASDVGSGSQTVENVIDHQASGLLDPTDAEGSTAGLHLVMFADGFRAAVHTPLGLGLGATTNAAGKFGGAGVSSEVDLTDLVLSLGLAGGVLYAVLIGLVLMAAVRVWRQTRSATALAILGVLLVCAGQWLRGGEYGTVAIVWLLIGALDRTDRDLRQDQDLRQDHEPLPST